MVGKLIISCESMLEVEKYMQQKNEVTSSNEYDLLYNQLKTDKQVEETKQELGSDSDNTDEPSSDESTDIEENSNDVQDTETDDVKEPEVSEEETSEDDGEKSDESSEQSSVEERPKEDKPEVANESIGVIALCLEEGYYGSYGNSDRLIGIGKFLMDKTIDITKTVISSLYSVGVTYGPTIAKNVYKGVLYASDKFIRLMYSSYVSIDKYLERRIHSFDNLKKNIKSLNDSISLLKEKDDLKDITDLKLTDSKLIDSIRIDDSVDLVSNVQVLASFVNTVVTRLDSVIQSDIKEIRYLMANAGNKGFITPTTLGKITYSNLGLRQGNLDRFNYDSEYLEAGKYDQLLPSNVTLVAYLPNRDLSELEDLAKAINKSTIFLGLSIKEASKTIESIDYMNLEDLLVLIDKLDNLCDICIKHQTLYENLKKSKKHLRFSFKNFFLRIASQEDKVSLKDSSLEFLYLKYTLVDKVYLKASIDIHDYAAKAISSYLDFVKNNIKQLS